MELLDLKNKVWNTTAEQENYNNRLDEYYKILSSLQKNPDNSLTTKYCFNSNKDFLTVERLGSQSACGEVYKFKLKTEKQIAVKIMPRTTKDSEKQNKNEIDIATKASNLVIQGKTMYFPLVYGHTYCKNTMYDEKSNFYKSTKSWCLENQISEKKGHKHSIKFFKNTHNMNINQKIEYVKETIPDIVFKMEIESDVLLSELAWGDLHTFLNENLKKMLDEDLYQIFGVILEIIMDMQNKLHIIHKDFHTGNILVKFNKNKGINLLAHDFGKSQILETFTKEDYLIDVETITNKLLENYLEQHPYMGPLLNKLLKYIDNLQNNDNIMMSIIHWWKNVENVENIKQIYSY